MCGIVGVLAFPNSTQRVTEELITSMRDTMEHRGPDGAGTWVSPNGQVGLGHRRLAIVDLSPKATQPMATADGRYHLTFNGEIYNHEELRNELTRAGCSSWQTDHSDTEVLLQALATWGIEAIHRFRGMFAFALWDALENELLLVRDRIGIKPLYYSLHNGRITFASEIKALLQDPEQQRAVDETAFVDYLSFLTTPGPETLFRGIHKLPGGHYLRVRASGEWKKQRYWDALQEATPLVDSSRAEISERIREELRIAVALRKVSDVPVGVFLSGGIDSSTNAALFSEGEADPVRTFSIGYDRDYGTYQNELEHARFMAAQIDAEHHEKLLNQQDLLTFLEEMVTLQDEPLADPVCVPVYYVAQLARAHGVKVCQVGEGADELFWGYPAWRRAWELDRANQWPVPKLFKQLGLRGLRSLGKDESHPYEWLRRGAEGLPIFWGGAEGLLPVGLHKLLSQRLRIDHEGRTGWDAIEPIWNQYQAHAWEHSAVHWMSYLDLQLRLPELLLMRVDKMTMGVSLEGRVPFLDHRLVELAMGIPAAVKTHGKELKGILKDAVRGIIPDTIIDRPKQGFGVPVHEWFLESLGKRAEAEIHDFAAGTDLIDPAQVSRLFERQRGNDLWVLLNVALWWKRYIA